MTYNDCIAGELHITMPTCEIKDEGDRTFSGLPVLTCRTCYCVFNPANATLVHLR